MSNTQARHSRFSMTEMDSTGKAERSRGWNLWPRFGFSASFVAGDFFDGAGLAGFAMARFLTIAVRCRSSEPRPSASGPSREFFRSLFLTGLDFDFVLRAGMGLTDRRVYGNAGVVFGGIR